MLGQSSRTIYSIENGDKAHFSAQALVSYIQLVNIEDIDQALQQDAAIRQLERHFAADRETIGNDIATLRKAKTMQGEQDWGLRGLSAKTHIPLMVLGNLETGKGKISVFVALGVLNALDEDTIALATGSFDALHERVQSFSSSLPPKGSRMPRRPGSPKTIESPWAVIHGVIDSAIDEITKQIATSEKAADWNRTADELKEIAGVMQKRILRLTYKLSPRNRWQVEEAFKQEGRIIVMTMSSYIRILEEEAGVDADKKAAAETLKTSLAHLAPGLKVAEMQADSKAKTGNVSEAA